MSSLLQQLLLFWQQMTVTCIWAYVAVLFWLNSYKLSLIISQTVNKTWFVQQFLWLLHTQCVTLKTLPEGDYCSIDALLLLSRIYPLTLCFVLFCISTFMLVLPICNWFLALLWPKVGGADGLTGSTIATISFYLLKLFLLYQVKSSFDATWYEWCEGKALQSYRAHFEYLHKLC